MARLGALVELDLGHIHDVALRSVGKLRGSEMAIAIATSEIVHADLPDDVSTVFQVVLAQPALARVLVRVAEPRARQFLLP